MNNLQNHKIFAMEESKRINLLTVAMDEFANNGYKKTTTDEIIKKSHISKGLLFYYFGTKKDLFLFLFDYSINTLLEDYYKQIKLADRDILKRFKSLVLSKIELTNKYPSIFEFVVSAFFEKDPAVATKISLDNKSLFIQAQEKILSNIDLSLFKPNIDVKRAIDIIVFTFKGYSEAQAKQGAKLKDYKEEYSRYIKEIDEYILTLKTAFYKE